jgi:hypothetical protein
MESELPVCSTKYVLGPLMACLNKAQYSVQTRSTEVERRFPFSNSANIRPAFSGTKPTRCTARSSASKVARYPFVALRGPSEINSDSFVKICEVPGTF